MRIPSCNSLSLLSHDLWSLLSCKNIVLSHQMRRICSSRALCLFHGIYSVVVLACRCQQNFFSKVLELHTHEPPTDVYVVYIHFSMRNLRRTSINNKRKFSEKYSMMGLILSLSCPPICSRPHTHLRTHTQFVSTPIVCLGALKIQKLLRWIKIMARRDLHTKIYLWIIFFRRRFYRFGTISMSKHFVVRQDKTRRASTGENLHDRIHKTSEGTSLVCLLEVHIYSFPLSALFLVLCRCCCCCIF